MPFSELAGHRHIVAALESAMAAGRLGHAYLFFGPAGTGKSRVALALARALNCPQLAGDFCGRCRTCQQIAAGCHPDVHRVRRPADKQFLGLGTIQELQRTVGLKPLAAAVKVFILDEVETMTVPAANAFLKVLEEPPPRTLFILMAPGVGGLLPTIVSRCQTFRFAAPGDAVPATDERVKVLRQKLFPQRGGGFEAAAELLKEAASQTSSKAELRGLLTETLYATAALFRDARVLKLGGAGVPLMAADASGMARTMAERVPGPLLDAALGEVFEAMELLERMVAPEPVIERMAVRVHSALYGAPRGEQDAWSRALVGVAGR